MLVTVIWAWFMSALRSPAEIWTTIVLDRGVILIWLDTRTALVKTEALSSMRSRVTMVKYYILMANICLKSYLVVKKTLKVIRCKGVRKTNCGITDEGWKFSVTLFFPHLITVHSSYSKSRIEINAWKPTGAQSKENSRSRSYVVSNRKMASFSQKRYSLRKVACRSCRVGTTLSFSRGFYCK